MSFGILHNFINEYFRRRRNILGNLMMISNISMKMCPQIMAREPKIRYFVTPRASISPTHVCVLLHPHFQLLFTNVKYAHDPEHKSTILN